VRAQSELYAQKQSQKEVFLLVPAALDVSNHASSFAQLDVLCADVSSDLNNVFLQSKGEAGSQSICEPVVLLHAVGHA
jgi:hypothetical protein